MCVFINLSGKKCLNIYANDFTIAKRYATRHGSAARALSHPASERSVVVAIYQSRRFRVGRKWWESARLHTRPSTPAALITGRLHVTSRYILYGSACNVRALRDAYVRVCLSVCARAYVCFATACARS